MTLFHSFIIFGAKFEISGTKWVEKNHPYIPFLLLVKKKMSLSRKNKKKRKNSKNLKVAGNYPDI